MKKNYKKLFILILSIIASIAPIMTTYAETVAEKFNATYYTIKDVPIYINSRFNAIKTTDGKFIYCLQFDKNPPIKEVTYTKNTLITDNGMNYLLKKAYNIKTDEEYFIYKSAVWLYMVDRGIMEGSHKTLTAYYSEVKKSNTPEAKQILELVEAAKKASANDTSAPTIKVDTSDTTFTLDSTGKSYISSAITVTSSTGSYNVSLTNAPEGSTFEKNGNTIIIKVPANKVANLETPITFKVSNSKDIYTAYKYSPSNSNYQPVANMYKETKTSDAVGKLTLKRTVSVPFLKVDAETGETISGAELKLTNSAGKVIKTWTSSKDAEVVTGLTAGTYTLTETKAPDGYKAIDVTVKFSIDAQGNILDSKGEKIVKIIITNEKKTGGVEISKQDITNKEELPGATLVIKDSTRNIIGEWVSTDKPHYIEKLTPGTYTLTETIAPVGYILSEETITFEVKDDGSITKVVMYNTPLTPEEVPVEPTSSFKTMTSGIIGTIIIMAGSILILVNTKKKQYSK